MSIPTFRVRLANGLIERALQPGVYTVGRSAENTIQIDDFSISRRHARITVEDGPEPAAIVEDLGSSGGTIAGGQRLTARTPHRLAPGEALRFGDVQAEIAWPEAIDAAAPAATAVVPSTGGQPAEAESAQPPQEESGVAATAPEPLLPEPQPVPHAEVSPGAEAVTALEVTPPLPETSAAPEVVSSSPPPVVTEPSAEPSNPPPPVPGEPAVARVISPLAGAILPSTSTAGATAEPARPPSRVRLTLAMPQSDVEPGQRTTAMATLVNRSQLVEQVALTVDGVPAEWVSVEPQTLALMPNDQATVAITFNPPKHWSARAAEYAFTVLAHSASAAQDAVAVGAFGLRSFDALETAIQPAQGERDFRIEVQNNGNSPRSLQVEGHDDEGVLQFDLGNGRLELEPGATGTLPVRVSPGARPWTGRQEIKAFTVRLESDREAKPVDLAGRLMVSPRLGSARKLVGGLAGLLAVLAVAVGLFLTQCGGSDEPALVVVPTPTVVPAELIKKQEDEDVHLCSPDEPGPPAAPAPGTVRAVPDAVRTSFTPGGDPAIAIDPTAPLFAQNDARWAGEEYAKARDDEFRAQNLCGSTIAQCGCAMTSVVTVMTLFQIAAMPSGEALTPQQLNGWLNIGATRTARGWVSQGYIYGDVIWAAANQLSAEIARARPGTPTIRFRGTGSGSESQIREELAAGRPIILEVPGHWIAAVGIDPTTNKILINDPFYADRTTLDVYAGKVRSSVLFEPSKDLSALVVTVPSDLRVRVIDPQGHVVGTFEGGKPVDAAAKAIKDIPGASYVFRNTWRDPTCINKTPGPDAGTNQIVITGPDAGKWRIEVVNPQGGSTSVAVHLYDEDGNLSMRTEDKSGDQRLDIVIGAPTPTPQPTATTPPTNTSAPPTQPPTSRPPTNAPPTNVPPTATWTPVPPTATWTATSVPPTATWTPAPPTATPTTAVLPPVAQIRCSYRIVDGPYAGTVTSALVLFNCTGSFTPNRSGTTTAWYVIESNGDVAEFRDYRNSTSFEYQRLMSSGERFTIRFEACYQGACGQGEATITLTFTAPPPTPTPTTFIIL